MSRRMETQIALPGWLPPGVRLDGRVSVYVGTDGQERTVQLRLPVEHKGPLFV
ncbi:MAG: hypothetical protein AB1551_06655 [Actinomycetota bacterium]